AGFDGFDSRSAVDARGDAHAVTTPVTIAIDKIDKLVRNAVSKRAPPIGPPSAARRTKACPVAERSCIVPQACAGTPRREREKWTRDDDSNPAHERRAGGAGKRKPVGRCSFRQAQTSEENGWCSAAQASGVEAAGVEGRGTESDRAETVA